MKYKLLFLLLIIFLSPFIAGLYGGLHDQVTYTVSPEYFTKFKFYQFGLEDNGLATASTRLKAAIVGVLATWWFGFPIGVLLGLVGLIHDNARAMIKYVAKAFLLALAVTALTPVVALPFYIVEPYFSSVNSELYQPVLPWFVPDGVQIIDAFSFYIVGIIHSYSYLGGLLGMMAGIIYQVRKYRKNKAHRRFVSISQVL